MVSQHEARFDLRHKGVSRHLRDPDATPALLGAIVQELNVTQRKALLDLLTTSLEEI